MNAHRISILLCVAGILLVAAGLLLWWLAAPDLWLHHAVVVEPHTAMKRAAKRLSNVGGLAAMGPLAIAVACGLALRRRYAKALWLTATVTIGRLLVEGLKEIVRRPRPPIGDRVADVTSWSFPSSHSAGSMMTLLAFALLAGGRWWGLLPALMVGAAIGWSRLALGVHWPSDVLAGWGMGVAWIGLAMRWLPSARKHPSRSGCFSVRPE